MAFSASSIRTIDASATKAEDKAPMPSVGGTLGAVLAGRFCNRLSLWLEKRRGRKALRGLTDQQLEDIGLTRGEATREVAKSFFWD